MPQSDAYIFFVAGDNDREGSFGTSHWASLTRFDTIKRAGVVCLHSITSTSGYKYDNLHLVADYYAPYDICCFAPIVYLTVPKIRGGTSYDVHSMLRPA
jgi:hypothetical protein